MKEFDTIIIGTTAAALGIAARLGGDCLVIDRGWSACREFGDAMRADPVDMSRTLSPFTASVREELLRRRILSEDGRLHVLALGGVFAARFLQTGCTLLLGAHLEAVRPAEDGFAAELFEVQDGRRTVFAKHIIDTTVHEWMECRKMFAVMLANDAALTPSENLLHGYFDDEFILRFEVPAACDFPAAQALADGWFMSHPECTAASIALEFGHLFDAPLDTMLGDGVRYLPSASFPDVLAALEGGAACHW